MNNFTGTKILTGLVLRRDRFVLPGWVGMLTLLTVGTSAQYTRTFPTQADRKGLVDQVSGNDALTAFTGQLHGHGLGNLTAWKIGDIAYTLIALFAVITMVRHTRAEEESGRQELLNSGVVGRYAALTASLIVTLSASLLTGVLIALGLTASGVDATGSVAFGLAIAMPGCVFAAIAAITAQLTERARTANVIAVVVLGAAYLTRFLADGSGAGWLRWLTPTGWSHLLQPYGNEAWWTLALPIVTTALAIGAGYLLVSRRDLGSGVLPVRGGPAEAGSRLRGPLGLAWRIQRGALYGWTAAFAVVGAGTAAVATGMPQVANQAGSAVEEFFQRYAEGPGADIGDIFVWMILISLGGAAALYPMLAILRLWHEESSGRAELTLSTAVGRLRWAWGHILFAAVGSAAMMAAAGVTAGLAYGLSSGDMGELPRVLAAALLMIPPVWTVGAAGLLAYAAVPRMATAIVWAIWLLVNVAGESLGPILGVDYWIANTVVPFHHVPKILSGGEFSAVPLLALTAVAVLIGGAGMLRLRRRDLV